MIARCTMIKYLFSKTGNVILHKEIIEVLICFGFYLAACLYKKMIQEEPKRTALILYMKIRSIKKTSPLLMDNLTQLEQIHK